MEDIEDIIEGVLEHPVEEKETKGWIKKSFSKKWKKGFYILRKDTATEQAFIQWYDKEENWRNNIPRGTLELFTQYRVIKHNDMKGRHYVFEVNNDNDTYILAAESETVMDLWVMQLQMQTRLNPRVEGKTFKIKGSTTKPMQRIGAKDQNCLLHISKWGITLALERTRSVLAQWPLTTIRNYESMDRGEFSFEAGRRSPMGEGKYTFDTLPGEDNRIFDAIDKYASQRLNAHRGAIRPVANSEEEMSRAYDQLRFSVLNFHAGPLDDDSQAHSTPRPINNQPDADSYSHIGRSDSIGSGRLSIGSFSTSGPDREGYDSIDQRHSSFGSRTEAFPINSVGNYDCLDHARSQISLSVKEGHGGFGRLNRSPSGYSHIASSFRGMPDYPRKDAHGLCPLEVSPESDRVFSDGGASPVSDDPLQMSGEFTPLQNTTVSSSTLTSDDPPPLPARSKKRFDNPPVEMLPPVEALPPRKECPPPPPPPEDNKPIGDARGKTLPLFGRKKFELNDLAVENGLYGKTSASPNFVYLNSTHSKSVEVLSTLYATVDKSKKKKSREAVEKRRKEYEAVKQRRKSRSHESLAGSPRLNSFSFSPFCFKGLAAMDSSSEEGLTKSDFEIENALVAAQTPKVERVSMAFKGSLKRDNEINNKAELSTINAGKPSSLSSPKDMEALQRAISNSPRFGSSKKKNNGVNDSSAA